MSSLACPVFFSYVVLTQFLFLIFVAAQRRDLLHYLCVHDMGNFDDNSMYSANLNRLVSSLTSLPQKDYGFHNLAGSGGTTGETVNAMALCRGDIQPVDCVRCIEAAGKELTKQCPNQKEAASWYEDCMFRYSSRSIFKGLETNYSFPINNMISLTDKEGFDKALVGLLLRLRNQAASGGPNLKFATGLQPVTAKLTIWARMQCTPDLSQTDCKNCLTQNIATIPSCCSGKTGGVVLSLSCNLKFDIKGTGNDKLIRMVVSVVVPVVAAILFIACLCVFLRARKKKMKLKFEDEKDTDALITVDSLRYDIGTIRLATNNFSSTNEVGRGGFGNVYKGTLPDGQEIAVKRLSMNSGQGDNEFKNEVLLVAKLQHRNLVKLLGFCLEGKERLLIYEFVPNSSLDHFLFDPVKRKYLDWERRFKIIEGIARGLLYLHQDSRLRIIHRDLKAGNILLDHDMCPKISDFGLARLFDINETQGSTNRIVGTYGYMAPEYAMHGYFSVKTDVFSFGVLILEIISGQRNRYQWNGNDIEDLLSCAWKNWEGRAEESFVDPSLTSGSIHQMRKCIHIGLLCVQENEEKRPTMGLVVLMLNSDYYALPTPAKPALYTRNADRFITASSSGSRSKLLPMSVNQVTVTELYPR